MFHFLAQSFIFFCINSRRFSDCFLVFLHYYAVLLKALGTPALWVSCRPPVPADPAVTALLIIFGPQLPDSRTEHVRIRSSEQTGATERSSSARFYPSHYYLLPSQPLSCLTMQRQTGIRVNARWRRTKENTQKRTVRALNFTLAFFDFENVSSLRSLDISWCQRVATVYTLCWIHSTFSGRTWCAIYCNRFC